MSREDTDDEVRDAGELPEWRFTIWHCLGLIVLFIVLNLLTYFAITRLDRVDPKDLSWVHIAIVNGISGAITAWAGSVLTGFSISKALSLEGIDTSQALSALITILGVSVLCSELNNVLQWLYPITDFSDTGSNFISQNLTGVLFTVAVIAPVTEELIFRGVILDGLRESYPLRMAIFVSALLFGMVHVHPWMMVNAFLLGLLFALIRLRTGSLLLCMLIHGTYNALPFILVRVFGLQIPGYTPLEAQVVQFQPLWFDALGLALAILGLAGLRFTTQATKEPW